MSKSLGLNLLVLVWLIIPNTAYCECADYKIVDYGDRVEAVCVGTPLTESEKKELERAAEVNEIKSKKARKEDKYERREDTSTNLGIRGYETDIERQEIALEREKERLRREKLKNDNLEDKMDDMSKKLDGMIHDSPSNIQSKKKKKK